MSAAEALVPDLPEDLRGNIYARNALSAGATPVQVVVAHDVGMPLNDYVTARRAEVSHDEALQAFAEVPHAVQRYSFLREAGMGHEEAIGRAPDCHELSLALVDGLSLAQALELDEVRARARDGIADAARLGVLGATFMIRAYKAGTTGPELLDLFTHLFDEHGAYLRARRDGLDHAGALAAAGHSLTGCPDQRRLSAPAGRPAGPAGSP